MGDVREALSLDWRTYRTLKAKELKAYAVNPATYIILVVFLLAGYLFLFSDFFLIGQASLSGYFDVLPWLVLFLIPALTMNLFSVERRDGTLEKLLTQPITTWQLIVSKYLS
jgi:ABC-2 type transport system permease protein